MVLTIAVALTWISTNDKIEYFDAQVVLPKEELVPEALAVSSICNANIADVQSKSNFTFKKLHALPISYVLQDSDVIEGQVNLFYAPGSICGENSKYVSFSDGLLQVYIADQTGDSSAAGGAEVFTEMKNNAQKPDTMQIFTINGNPAIGWEPGVKNSVAMYENGTVVHTEEVGYPAKLQFIDQNSKLIYKLKGYFALDDLKKIASSFK